MFGTPGFTVAVQVSTTVRPSSSVSIGAAAVVEIVVPVKLRVRGILLRQIRVSTVDRVDRHGKGRSVFAGSGTFAQFWPFTKKPKTSLNPWYTNSLYSSEPNA